MGRVLPVLAVVLCSIVTAAASPASQVPNPADKARRTAAERKIDSQLLIEIEKREPGRPQGAPAVKTGVRIDKMERALVDVRADVTPPLTQTLRDAGSLIVSTSAQYRSIVAWMPLAKIKSVAASPAVQAVMPAPEAALQR